MVGPVKRVTHAPRLCDYCGGEFRPNRADARYCRKSCKDRDFVDKKRAKAKRLAGTAVEFGKANVTHR